MPLLKRLFLQELQRQVDIFRERRLAAPDQNRREEQMELVDQSSLERMDGRPGPPIRIRARGCFYLPNHFGIEVPSIRVFRVDTYSSVLEYTILSAACHIPRSLGRVGTLRPSRISLPKNHHLIHPAPIQVGAGARRGR